MGLEWFNLFLGPSAALDVGCGWGTRGLQSSNGLAVGRCSLIDVLCFGSWTGGAVHSCFGSWTGGAVHYYGAQSAQPLRLAPVGYIARWQSPKIYSRALGESYGRGRIGLKFRSFNSPVAHYLCSNTLLFAAVIPCSRQRPEDSRSLTQS